MADLTADELRNKRKGGTVRQTIVETFEAPRLNGIDTADFVVFQQTRALYERNTTEDNADTNSQVPLTTYRNSIARPVLEFL